MNPPMKAPAIPIKMVMIIPPGIPSFWSSKFLRSQTEQCAARLQRRNIDLKGWTFNLRLR